MSGKKSPWLLGKEAFWDGKAEEENPFAPEGQAVLTGDAEQWQEGYAEAKQDADEEEHRV